MKRLFDILASILGLLVFAPFFLLIAILMKMESRGHVFFLHTRIGKKESLSRCINSVP